MEKITQAEWSAIVEKLKKSPLPIPPSFVANLDDWKCRSNAGRALYSLGDYDNAIIVLVSVLDVEPNLDDNPEEGFSEAEHKVLCLMCMVDLIWGMMQNGDAALMYLDKALAICEKFTGVFHSQDPLQVWHKRLDILKKMGKEEQAQAEEQKGWHPACHKAQDEVLDIAEVRRRQSQAQDKSGFQAEDLLKGIQNNLGQK